MGRTTSYPSRPAFVVDQSSITRNQGRQISWADVPVSYKDAAGNKFIPAGKVMVELLTGANVGKIVPRSDRPAGNATDPATCILETNASENSKSDAKTGYGCITGGAVFENLLPDATGAPKTILAAMKTELRAAGGAWIFSQYGDSR